MRFQRPAVLLAAAAVLAACGPVHPGAAATVDGRDISFKTLDRTARVYCEVTAKTQQTQQLQGDAQPIDNAQIRRQAVTDLVLAKVAADVARREGVTAEPAAPPSTAELQQAFGSRAGAVRAVIVQSQDTYQLLAAIGARGLNTTLSADNADQLAEAGRNLVLAEFDRYGVEFAPRLGLDDSGDATGGIGSLSVQPVDTTPTTADQSAVVGCRA